MPKITSGYFYLTLSFHWQIISINAHFDSIFSHLFFSFGHSMLNQKKKYAFIHFLLLLFVFFPGACKKESIDIALSINKTPVNERIETTYWLNSTTGLFCGGTLNESGFIYRTTDNGSTWTKVLLTDIKLNDVYFINDSIGYCCGEDLALYRTADGGLTWNRFVYPVAAPEYDVVDLKKIFGNEKLMMIVGGENFNKGVSLRFINDGFSWNFYHSDHEFKDGYLYSEKESLVFGYGYAFRSNDSGQHFQNIPLTNDFFTGVSCVNNELFVSGYNGGIYHSTNKGESWNEIHRARIIKRKKPHFNGILMLDSNTGYVVGDNGILMKTINGKNWKNCTTTVDADILSIKKNGTKIILSTSDGNLISFEN